MDLLDRIQGSMLGLALGDALGHPTEFISSVGRIKARFGDRGIVEMASAGPHKAGTFTDDTQMTICVARALALSAGKGLDALMEQLALEFIAWADHPTNSRAPGGTCLAGCRKLKGGAHWKDAGVKGSKGCGAAMRAAPIAWYYYDDDDALVRVAAAQSVLTHSHPTGVASSVAAAAPVAWLLKGNGIDGMIDYTKKMTEKLDKKLLVELGVDEKAAEEIGVSEQMTALHDTWQALEEEDEDVCNLLGGAWVGEEAVACALWCFIKADGDPFEAMRRGANSSGDSDSIACIAGSLAGALHGVSKLPPSWLEQLERREDLKTLASELHAAKLHGDRSALPSSTDFFDTHKGIRVRVSTGAHAGVAMNTMIEDDSLSSTGEEDGDADEDPHEGSDSFNDVAALEAAIEKHNELYWVYAKPEISDVEFDRLCRRLKELAPQSKVLEHLGPPPAASPVTHKEPMLSLDKCYVDDELAAWTNDFSGDVLAMPKVDGLACCLSYDEDGWLFRAATRGDGEVGEDVTANVRAIADVPRRVGSGPVEVRGEVYLSKARFDELRSEKPMEASNPRNMAAGALRQKDPNATKKTKLSFLAYDLRGVDTTTQREKLALLAGLGFPPIPQAIAPKHLAKVAVDELAKRKDALPYETDGVVVMVDEVAQQRSLGATAHHPRWAIAWKFQGEEGESVLRAIEWSVARTGTITPVGIVDPVALSGVTVTRVTLHHLGFVDEKKLHIGARVAMVRRGGVIPHVERVIAAADVVEAVALPQLCPSCGASVVREGDFLMCGKPNECVAARVRRLIHWGASVDIKGLGESVVEQLVERGLVKTPADLYTLDALKLASLDRMGPALAQKLVDEIDKSRRLKLDVLLTALGIEGLGKSAARTIAARFGTLQRVRITSVSELSAMKGFGEVSAKAIVAGLAENGALLDALAAHVVSGEAEAITGPLKGLSFVFTGALSFDRKQAEQRVRALGAETPSGVTKTLTHLVVGGDRSQPSTKQKAAEKLINEGASIAILDEAGFTSLLVEVGAPAVEEPKQAVAAAVVEEKQAEEPKKAEAPKTAEKKQLSLF